MMLLLAIGVTQIISGHHITAKECWLFIGIGYVRFKRWLFNNSKEDWELRLFIQTCVVPQTAGHDLCRFSAVGSAVEVQ